jgi:hypothetical protein
MAEPNHKHGLLYQDSLGNEYSGNSALEVIDTLFQKTRKGIPDMSFKDWQRDQLGLVMRFRKVSIKDLETEENAQLYLNARAEGDLTQITNPDTLSR